MAQAEAFSQKLIKLLSLKNLGFLLKKSAAFGSSGWMMSQSIKPSNQ